jgi:hypothetical protein
VQYPFAQGTAQGTASARTAIEAEVTETEVTIAGRPQTRSPAVLTQAQKFSASALSPSPRTVVAIFALYVVFLFALNVLHAYQLGFQTKMYDSPIYRWRESLVIALSRMQPQPLHGYVGYGSILSYLTHHGVALIGGEADPMPTGSEQQALVMDGARMDRLMQEASKVTIDPSLPPVILQGNELGLVDYTYWAFKLYGISVNALVLFYFTLLFISVALFFIVFRQSPFCLLLLMLYLAAHYFALDYAQTRAILAIQNSRFFPVLALLPALHLFLLLVMRVRPTAAVVAGAAVQTLILMFMVFCRTQTYWEIFAILLGAVVVTGLGPVRQALLRPKRWLGAIGETVRETWPAVLTVLGVVALLGYTHFAPDESLYAKESKAHLFWHDFFVSTVSADPQLLATYGFGSSSYTDDMGYLAALHDLRGRNDGSTPIADEVNGVLGIDIWKSNGAYDEEMRQLYFRVLREHPWPVVRSFLIGKPVDQLAYFSVTPELWQRHNYVNPMILAVAATLLALALGAALPTRRTALLGSAVIVVVLACSTMTSFFYPTALIAEVLVTWLMLFMFGTIYLPLTLLFYFLRQEAVR